MVTNLIGSHPPQAHKKHSTRVISYDIFRQLRPQVAHKYRRPHGNNQRFTDVYFQSQKNANTHDHIDS